MAERSYTGAELEPQFDRSKLGKVLAEADVEITDEAALRYARTVGETNPRFSRPGPGLEVMPGMLIILDRPMDRVPVTFPFGKLAFPGGNTLEAYDLVRPGDILHIAVRLTEVYVKTGRAGPMGFVVHEKEYVRRRDGKLVARSKDTYLTRP